MALSPSTGMIIPEVYAAAVKAKINGNLVFRNFSTTFSELEGQPGDTLNLTQFARLADLTSDQDETVPLTPEALTSDSDALIIREAAKAVEITKRANLTAFGNPVDEAQRETARVITKRVDEVLRDAAYGVTGDATVPVFVDETDGAIDNAAVTNALAPYGDRVVAEGDVSLVIHSRQWADLKSDPKFERADAGQRSHPGLAGILDGIIPVYVSDLVTEIVDGGGAGVNHYRALLFAAKPLAFGHKKAVEIAQQEDILARTITVVSSLHYAGGVMTAGDIVELRTTVKLCRWQTACKMLSTSDPIIRGRCLGQGLCTLALKPYR